MLFLHCAQCFTYLSPFSFLFPSSSSSSTILLLSLLHLLIYSIYFPSTNTSTSYRPYIDPFQLHFVYVDLGIPAVSVLGITAVSVLQNTRGSTKGRERAHYSENKSVRSKSQEFSRKFKSSGVHFNDLSQVLPLRLKGVDG